MLRHGSSRSFCNMYDTTPLMPRIGVPSIVTVPVLGISRPAMMLKIVDFPQPLGPRIVRKRPRGIASETGASAATVWPRTDFEIL